MRVYMGQIMAECDCTSAVCEQRGYCMAERIEKLEVENKLLNEQMNELLIVSKRAVRLSLDYSDFKLYAMEPMREAITAAEKVMK